MSVDQRQWVAPNFAQGDFSDYYSLTPYSQAPLREIASALISKPPKWFEVLFRIRNLLVAPFGLVHKADETKESIAFFPVISEEDNELVLGLDDKHLDFRIHVMRNSNELGFGTWVHPHNLFGRIYLGIVIPFHKLICKHWQRSYREIYHA